MADVDMIRYRYFQNIGDIDILYCSALWPVFHYRQHSSQ